jgi:hypothetical protein
MQNAITDVIEKFCAETRRTLREHGYALSKHVAGQVPDNVAADQVNQRGVRLRHTEHEKVFVEEPLSENFTLAIKHPVAFTALLATLRERFDCYAIIRYPLSTMASLNSMTWLNVAGDGDREIRRIDFIARPGAGKIFSRRRSARGKLELEDVNKFYDRALMLDLGERLLRREGSMWDYYKRSDVEQLMAEVSALCSLGFLMFPGALH